MLVLCSFLDKLGHGACEAPHHPVFLLPFIARPESILCVVLPVLSVRHLVAVVKLVRVFEEPLHQGRDHREVPEVRHPERGGRGHEDLPRQGRGQCGNGALLLLLVRKQ